VRRDARCAPGSPKPAERRRGPTGTHLGRGRDRRARARRPHGILAALDAAARRRSRTHASRPRRDPVRRRQHAPSRRPHARRLSVRRCDSSAERPGAREHRGGQPHRGLPRRRAGRVGADRQARRIPDRRRDRRRDRARGPARRRRARQRGRPHRPWRRRARVRPRRRGPVCGLCVQLRGVGLVRSMVGGAARRAARRECAVPARHGTVVRGNLCDIRLLAERADLWLRVVSARPPGMASVLLRPLGVVQAVGLDVDRNRSLGMANTPLWPLGLLVRRLVLDSRAHLGTGLGVVGVRARLRQLVPARLEQHAGVLVRRERLRRLSLQPVARLDGGPAPTSRLRLRQRQRRQRRAHRRQDAQCVRRPSGGTRRGRVRRAAIIGPDPDRRQQERILRQRRGFPEWPARDAGRSFP
jgi:hypothetical protein